MEQSVNKLVAQMKKLDVDSLTAASTNDEMIAAAHTSTAKTSPPITRSKRSLSTTELPATMASTQADCSNETINKMQKDIQQLKDFQRNTTEKVNSNADHLMKRVTVTV